MRSATLVAFAVATLAAARADAQSAPPPRPPPRVFHPPPRTPVSAKLAYRLDPGASKCPGDEVLRQEIARRMGYDPFTDDADGVPIGSVRVEIARSPKGFTGTYTFTGTDGVDRWTRSYSEPSDVWQACHGVSQGIAVELTGELQLVEMRLAREILAASRPPSPPEPKPPPAPLERAPPPTSSAPRPIRAIRGEVGAGFFAGGGTAPRATVGGALHVGLAIAPASLDRFRVSIAAEGRVDAPAVSDEGIKTQLFAGSLLACGHWDFVSWSGILLCGIGTAGAVRSGWQDAPRMRSNSGVYVGAGARLGFEVRFSPSIAVRAQGEALPTILGPRAFGHQTGVVSGGVAGNAGLAIVLAF